MRVPELTSKRDEGVKVLVNSCIRELDRIGVRASAYVFFSDYNENMYQSLP